MIVQLPEFPLPPFVAPGDYSEREYRGGDNTQRNYQADVRCGGDIYEGYEEGMRTRPSIVDSKSKSQKTATSADDADDNVVDNNCIALKNEEPEHKESILRTRERDGRHSKQTRHDSLTDIEELEDLTTTGCKMKDNFEENKIEEIKQRSQSAIYNNPIIFEKSRAIKSKSAGNIEYKENFLEALREINNSLSLTSNSCSPKQITADVIVHNIPEAELSSTKDPKL